MNKPISEGFTLIELLVVIAVIAVLAAVVAPHAYRAIEKAKVARAIQDGRTLRSAVEGYYADIGFWPPDVGRGWDPGFQRPLPYNPDTGATGAGGAGGDVPPNWQAIVQARWDGPYLEKWPSYTPWAGKYDWNYWPAGADRYGVTVPPGCYVGIQRDYSDQHPIPTASEQQMVTKGFDGDGAVNGEAQLLMVSL